MTNHNVSMQGIRVGSLGQIRKVFDAWSNIMRDRSWWGKDAPWWYTERTSLSLFAGAVWSVGGWAMEEYATNKRARVKRKKKRKGRGDLYFGIRGKDYVAEAKQHWSAIGSRAKDPLDGIKEAISLAKMDSSDVPALRARRLAIVFVVPWLNKTEKGQINNLIKEWLGRVQRIEGAAFVWTFPKNKRYLQSEHGYIYPGVLMILKPLRK